MKGKLTTYTEVQSRPTAISRWTFHPRQFVTQEIDTKTNSSPECSAEVITVAATEYGEPLLSVRTWTEWEPENAKSYRPQPKTEEERLERWYASACK